MVESQVSTISSEKSKNSKRAPKNIKAKGKHGGARSGSGRPQRKPSPWPENADLTSSIGLDRLLRNMIAIIWRENVLDARTVGALNNTIRLLLDLRGWVNPKRIGMDDPVEGISEKERRARRIEALERERDKGLEETVISMGGDLSKQREK